MHSVLQSIADTLVLSALLQDVRARYGLFEMLDHWKQGEFHHDVMIRVSKAFTDLPGPILVIATNCNGGVKEVLCFEAVPDRWALWHWRCPQVADFSGELPPIVGRAVTHHWFDPCALLAADARSELREEFRQRQRGGGWQMVSSSCGSSRKC